jgi:hypothetical protein
VESLTEQIFAADILNRLKSSDPGIADAAVADLKEILEEFDLVNPGIIRLLEESPDPAFHAQDIVDNIAINFEAGDPFVFIRTYPLNFAGIARLVDIVASFYRGYEPVNLKAMEDLFQACAREGSLGKEWPELNITVTETGETCGNRFKDIFETYNSARDTMVHPSRLGERLGTDAISSIIAVSGLTRSSIPMFQKARQVYDNASYDIEWDINFDDVDFGYWGNEALLDRASKHIVRFPDLKSEKFRSLGQATWLEVLVRSPAEPGISGGIETTGDFVTTGGWADIVPGQVLESIGCETSILIQQFGGLGLFQRAVATQLGASENEIDALANLEERNSGWTTAIRVADASYCSNWNACDYSDFRCLGADGWNAPLVTNDSNLRALFPDDVPNDQLPGCTPFLA